MNELDRSSESNRRRPRASSASPERPLSRKNSTGSLKFLIALILACAFAVSTTAPARADSYSDPVTPAQDATGRSLEAAIEEAVDLAYEDLYDELYAEQTLTTSCSVKLARTSVGSRCSCSAMGPESRADGTRTMAVRYRPQHARTA